MNLKGKLAVVTGSSSGIGLELCRLLAAKEATVYGLSRRESRVGQPGFHWLKTDVTNPEEIDEAFDRVLEIGRAHV